MTDLRVRLTWIGRSDGVLENNEPEQLNRTLYPDNYYELLSDDHPTTIEWKRQLGSLLQKAHQGDNAEPRWFLSSFPENYRLYKPVKPKPGARTAEAGVVKKAKNEAYLYGYPLGDKKKYRSAQEFFPHLLWLSTDGSEEYDDCACKLCSPDWIQKFDLPSSKASSDGANKKSSSTQKETKLIGKTDASAPRKETLPIRPEKSATVPKVVVQQRPNSSDRTVKPTSTKTPASTASGTPGSVPRASQTPSAQPGPQPTPILPPRSKEQAEDLQYRRFIYRPGEVTWFNRGQAWGLSVVVERSAFTDAHGDVRPRYIVQPLSHPFFHPQPKILSSDEDLRPWLAWSAPGPTSPALADPQWNFKNINWPDVVGGRFGPGDAEVDGSIFAAKMIDASFSLAEMITNHTHTTGERTYNSLFLGGEKIWVGEPIRLRINQGMDVMVLQQILEKLKPGSTNIALATVHAIGDVYRFVTLPAYQADTLPSMSHLPNRMQEDLNFRNRISVKTKKTVSYWNLIQPQARLSVGEVKGRWYESSILLPILRTPSLFQDEVARGDIVDVGSFLNARDGSNQKAGNRVKDRVEALGKSVRQNLRIGQGWDVAVQQGREGESVVDPSLPGQTMEDGSGMLNEGGGGDGNEGDISQFMDLDHVE